MSKAEAGVKAGTGGEDSWKALEKVGKIFSAKQQNVTVAKKCAPKLTKASMLQRATLARSWAAAKRPDPTCATGVASLKGSIADKPQACCPSYCGECSDYAACSSIRGQNSEGACCASKVLALECGGPEKTPVNKCLKKCSEAMPPCIMEEGEVWSPPEVTSAAEDCNEAVPEWMSKAEAGVKAGTGGEDSWKALEKVGKIFSAKQQDVTVARKNVTVAKKCAPKLTKAVMLQRSTLARSWAAAKRPDPTCA